MIVQRHPTGGFVECRFMKEAVALHCHWPADLENNEWIDIANQFDVASYSQAVRDAISVGSGTTSGITGGHLTITAVGDGFAIDFSRPQDGWSATSLRIVVRRPLAELLPEHGQAPARQAAAASQRIGPDSAERIAADPVHSIR